MKKNTTNNQEITAPKDHSPSQSHFIEWNDHNQPQSTHFQDVYFSPINGLEESRYVFLQGNQLTKRFQDLSDNQHFCIGETGFGTGLNFLSCWQLWQQHASPSKRLSYISVEKYPLQAEEIARSLRCWPELTQLSTRFVESYKKTMSARHATANTGFYVLDFDEVRLILIIDDAYKGFNHLRNCSHSDFSQKQWHGVDAWFLDGFTPSRNPDMWTETVFRSMVEVSHSKTTLATFTAASDVRKNLINAGFIIEKAKGFGKKREMLKGCIDTEKYVLSQSNRNTESRNISDAEIQDSNEKSSRHETNSKQKQSSPWAVNRFFRPATPQQTIAIIGAGLAGCHCAYSLAKRGFKVSLFDSGAMAAPEASGNPQGVLYGKMSADNQFLSEFNHTALRYAQQHYKPFLQDNPDHGEACGVLQLSDSDRSQTQQRLIAEQFDDSEFVHFLNSSQASAISGIELSQPGLFYPHCGWLNPRVLCEWLINQSNCITQFDSTVTMLSQHAEGWLLNAKTGQKSTEQLFETVIIANSHAAKQFPMGEWLPTKAIKGQVTYIPSQNPINQLKTVICSKGYIAPSTSINHQAQHAIGATYHLHDASSQLSESDNAFNLQQLNTLLSLDDQQALARIKPSDGRVGFRCASPDYLPLVGPAPHYSEFLDDYAELSANAKRAIPTDGHYHQGLYFNIGHGSRGLAYTPIAAEILASTIAGEPLPLSHTMAEKLNPGRFIIRNLSRTNKNQ